MPDLIRHPVQFWIPAFAGMTALTYIVAGVIKIQVSANTPVSLDISRFFVEYAEVLTKNKGCHILTNK